MLSKDVEIKNGMVRTKDKIGDLTIVKLKEEGTNILVFVDVELRNVYRMDTYVLHTNSPDGVRRAWARIGGWMPGQKISEEWLTAKGFRFLN